MPLLHHARRIHTGWLSLIAAAIFGGIEGWKLGRAKVKNAMQETQELPPLPEASITYLHTGNGKRRPA